MTSLVGKTVFITGGTGSFGKTVASRLLKEGEVARIIVFSRDEKKQHDMRLAFRDDRLQFEIGDVRDAPRVARAMKGADMIFHAAALKHVPACEFYPMEAVKTNIIGTDNVIEAALQCGADKLVVLSTDKAAYPVNAMGCSKMMMEKIMIARAQAQRPGDKTVLCGVRYGNVLLSRGSVVPLFIEQIQRGGSITITDPAMTRFLMPLREAVDLVLHALRDGQNGDLFIRMARAATIADLAQACQDLMQAKASIEIIGVRAGEKMHETLATSEELSRGEDQGDYWRIPCEGGREFARFFTQGDRKTAATKAFTSDNAEQLTAPKIGELLRTLPELAPVLGGERSAAPILAFD